MGSALLVLLVIFYLSAANTPPAWTPIMYRAGEESAPIRLSRVRTLGECFTAPLAFWRGIAASGGSISDWGNLCMRRCWILEDIVRPNAVRIVAGRCQVVVDGNPPQRTDATVG
jgi:hypothetical protein